MEAFCEASRATAQGGATARPAPPARPPGQRETPGEHRVPRVADRAGRRGMVQPALSRHECSERPGVQVHDARWARSCRARVRCAPGPGRGRSVDRAQADPARSGALRSARGCADLARGGGERGAASDRGGVEGPAAAPGPGARPDAGAHRRALAESDPRRQLPGRSPGDGALAGGAHPARGTTGLPTGAPAPL